MELTYFIPRPAERWRIASYPALAGACMAIQAVAALAAIAMCLAGLVLADITPPPSAPIPMSAAAKRDPVNVKTFGAVGNGVNDDTKAIQTAITSLGNTGGVLQLYGDFKIGNLEFPFRAPYILFDLNGKLILTTTLVLPDSVAIWGQGGGNINQFQLGSTAEIVPPPGNIDTIRFVGSASHEMRNISIRGPAGVGLHFDGASALGALARLDNVSVVARPNTPTSLPLLIDGFFWIWMEHCSFLSQPDSYPASIRITNTNPAFPNAGLLHLKDTQIAGHGIQLGSQVPANSIGNFSIEKVVYESGLDSFLRIDTTYAPASGIDLETVEIADAVSVPYVIEGNPGAVIRDVSIRNSPGLQGPYANVPIYGLRLEGGRMYDYTGGWQIGGSQKSYSANMFGVIDAEWAGQGANMSPSLVPFGTLNVAQDVTQWNTLPGSATVSTGVRAPDGSLTAAQLTASAPAYRQIYRAVPGLSAGDWILAGFWVKAESPAAPPSMDSRVCLNPGSSKFDNQTSCFGVTNDLARRIGAPWTPVMASAKIAALSAGSELIFSLVVDGAHPTSFWMPFMVRIPAGTMTDAEVIRYARFLRNFPSNMPSGGGIIALYPHQKLDWGGDTGLARDSAGVLRVTDGSDGTGSLHTSFLLLDPVPFASLGVPKKGKMIFCADCMASDPCAAGGPGALAKGLAGSWSCK
jgi:hypothetical protein